MVIFFVCEIKHFKIRAFNDLGADSSTTERPSKMRWDKEGEFDIVLVFSFVAQTRRENIELIN